MLGLTVYCNCIETSKALESPVPLKINVHEDGMLDIFCVNPDYAPQMHEWAETACPHPDFYALSDDFVNITGAAGMRHEISAQGAFPVLVGKVFQDGTTDHYLVPHDVELLQKEITNLNRDRLPQWSQEVIDKLSNAAAISLQMQKPICF